MERSGLRWEHVMIDFLHCVDQVVMSRVAANALLRGHEFCRKGTSLPEQIQHVSDDLRRWYAANPAVHRTQRHALFGPSASQCRHPHADRQSSRELIFGALPR